MKRDLPKAYILQDVEKQIYELWEKSGFFRPENLPGKRRKPFTIVMPPPNVTGTLHIGSACMLAIEDLMIRFERMRGKKTLWIPGTDHAAIATQTKVEKMLIKETGKTRHDLGREAFLERVRKFAQTSHDTIVHQIRSMGSSCDWSREAYTLDEPRSLAVRTMFKMMYDDGLIYRGTRVVNWDPEFQTTLADDEVESKETVAKLFTFRYDKNFPITISSTRPETKFGDTGVAVHPKDARYQKYVGQTLTAEFCGKKINVKVVADIAVDMTFGTGVLGVTPAHSKIDEEIAKRHGLASMQVIGVDGRMTKEAGAAFAGLTTLEARKKIEEMLKNSGALEKVEEVPQALPISQRGGGVVEELPMLQWFIDVNKKIPGRKKSLKELSLEAVKSGKIKIIPARFSKAYFHWTENLRDWCISRQIWFGHQIPVWYRGAEIYVGVEAPDGDGWKQDPDSLDTWFSSGLWTFSTLGWPKKTKELKFFHPTSVLETGYDILPFWVARMILMTTYALKQVPFRTVYLHGLVRDNEGRKMSKSLDNIIDPLDTNAKYGTDATRLSLVLGSSPGNDTKLSEEKIEGFRNFANKLWNISRFVLMLEGEPGKKISPQTLADRWILARLATVTKEVTKHLEQFRFSAAGELLRDFTWSEFADWYLEIAKVQMKNSELQPTTLRILHDTLETLLRLWHPFMPFVTETIWRDGGFSEKHGLLMVATWPRPARVKSKRGDADNFAKVQDAVTAFRNLRSEHRVPAGKKLRGSALATRLVEENAEAIKALANLEHLELLTVIPSEATAESRDLAQGVSALGPIALTLGEVNASADKARMQKELQEIERYIANVESKLANQDFRAHAPKEVVEKEESKLAEAKHKHATLKASLEKL